MNSAPALPLRIVTRASSPSRPAARVRAAARPAVAIRTATVDDADAIHGLITAHLTEGRLLPRERAEVLCHAARFVVAVRRHRIVACAELAPLSRGLAEVRSLVVADGARGAHLGRRLVDELTRRAALAGHGRLCALTHAPSYFVRMGFSIVPHVWLPEKIVADCHACAQFRRCGQFAVVREVPAARGASARMTGLGG